MTLLALVTAGLVGLLFLNHHRQQKLQWHRSMILSAREVSVGSASLLGEGALVHLTGSIHSPTSQRAPGSGHEVVWYRSERVGYYWERDESSNNVWLRTEHVLSTSHSGAGVLRLEDTTGGISVILPESGFRNERGLPGAQSESLLLHYMSSDPDVDDPHLARPDVLDTQLWGWSSDLDRYFIGESHSVCGVLSGTQVHVTGVLARTGDTWSVVPDREGAYHLGISAPGMLAETLSTRARRGRWIQYGLGGALFLTILAASPYAVVISRMLASS